GLLMWEMSSHDVPFKDKTPKEVFELLGNADYTSELPIIKDTPQVYVNIMTSCWNRDPTKRPSIQAIVRQLRELKPPKNGMDSRETTGLFIPNHAVNYTLNNITIQGACAFHSVGNYEEAF